MLSESVGLLSEAVQSPVLRPPDPAQLDLPLIAPPANTPDQLVPARMLNEWVYCPRLAYLEWVESEWAETADTAEGRRAHKRTDKPGPALKAADQLDEDDTIKTRALTVSSDRLGLIAKIDLLEADDGAVTIVDTKKGKRPHVAKGAYDPERIQLCAQALILEDLGYQVAGAFIWYAGSRERVPVVLDEELRRQTLQAAAHMRLTVAARRRPPPLDNSPKCVKCALAGICLPDEVNFFHTNNPPRPLFPAADSALPLYVQEPGARIGKSGNELIIKTQEKETSVPLIDISELVLFGRVTLTTPALHELMYREIPVAWLSTGGRLVGLTQSTGRKNVDIRIAQSKAAFDPNRSLAIARGLVAAKITNSRTLLRRAFKNDEASAQAQKKETLASLKRLAERAKHAANTAQLLGFEGEAAALYFRHFEDMISRDKQTGLPPFAFEHRNRRPPRDPVNAMLSLSYALLTRLFTTSLATVGFDPYLGFYHAIRHGRPALALDMMEPFRPIIADSTVLQVINNAEIAASDFVYSAGACNLTPKGRKALIKAFERRLSQEVTHPVFGYKLSTRRLIDVQCRLLNRHLQGEINELPHYLPR